MKVVNQSESEVEIIVDSEFNNFIDQVVQSDVVREYTKYSESHYCLLLVESDFIFSIDVFPTDGVQEDYSLEDFVKDEDDQEDVSKTSLMFYPYGDDNSVNCRNWVEENWS